MDTKVIISRLIEIHQNFCEDDDNQDFCGCDIAQLISDIATEEIRTQSHCPACTALNEDVTVCGRCGTVKGGEK